MKQTAQQRIRKTGAWHLALATLTLALAGATLQPAFAQGPDGHGMRSGHGSSEQGSPRQMQHMLDAVKATDAQRAQIRQIMEAAQADLKPMREAGRQLREQDQALFAQPAVDANAAEALRQQELVLHNDSSKRMLQARLDVSAVLTAEQRQLMSERMTERRAKMANRQAERQQQRTAPR